MGGLHYYPVFEFWLPCHLLNSIGLFLTTCFVSANGKPPLWPGVWVLAARSPAECYWSVLNYLLCFSQWEACTMTWCLRSGSPVPLMKAIGLFLTTCFVSANGRPPLWPSVWVLVSRCPAERYWSLINYLPCFSQWEACIMTRCLSSGCPVSCWTAWVYWACWATPCPYLFSPGQLTFLSIKGTIRPECHESWYRFTGSD